MSKNYKEKYSFNGEAYLIHLYKISDSKGIAILFTKDFGKIRGFIRINKKNSSILRPFIKIWFNASKKNKNITNIDKIEDISESDTIHISKFILVLFYLNELINLYLEEYAPRIKTFEIYSLIISSHANKEILSKLVVKFELIFLDDIGYGLSIPQKIDIYSNYLFHPNYGFFTKNEIKDIKKGSLEINGKTLEDIKSYNFISNETILLTREIFKLQIEWHLGKLPNNSRRILKSWNNLRTI